MISRKLGLVWALWCALSSVAHAACSETSIEVRSGDTVARFDIEVADDDQERALGLMNRPEMAPFAGMLFVYESEGPVSFWMKNTLIPLDMLFADATGTIQRIHSNAVPLSTETIPGGDNIKLVLEINGGLANTLGLTPGAVLRHPAVDPQVAAWPC